MNKRMTIEMPDGSVWAVPVSIIARHRAAHFADEFDDDVDLSLSEDTIPLFESSEYDIQDWASNNMSWSDFEGHAERIRSESACDYDEGLTNGKKGFIE